MMKKANAAQVMSGFMWKPGNDLPLTVVTGSVARGFEIDQTVLVEYLMKFQEFLYQGQPKEEPAEEASNG